MNNMNWQSNQEYDYQYLNLAQCEVTLSKRPHYCDRGNYIVQVFPKLGSELSSSLDEADMFPRYYFDETRAKLEMEAWTTKRGLV